LEEAKNTRFAYIYDIPDPYWMDWMYEDLYTNDCSDPYHFGCGCNGIIWYGHWIVYQHPDAVDMLTKCRENGTFAELNDVEFLSKILGIDIEKGWLPKFYDARRTSKRG
jgi:hypothetical protein